MTTAAGWANSMVISAAAIVAGFLKYFRRIRLFGCCRDGAMHAVVEAEFILGFGDRGVEAAGKLGIGGGAGWTAAGFLTAASPGYFDEVKHGFSGP